MTLVAVAFVPASPMLVPAVAAGAADDLDAVRQASWRALDRALSAEADEVVVMGSAPCTAGPGARGSAVGFGVDLTWPLHRGVADDGTRLPWPQAVGAWLLGERSLDLPRRAVGPGRLTTTGRTVVVAVGDGSARRTDKAPGALHPEAQAWDDTVAAALAAGDTGGLPDVGEQLADGPPVWAALAGTGPWHAELHAHEAPGGVGLFAASWLR